MSETRFCVFFYIVLDIDVHSIVFDLKNNLEMLY